MGREAPPGFPSGTRLGAAGHGPTRFLDDTGLLFYNARYYDSAIGRFISADTVVPGSPSGSMDGVAVKPLTVSFHEAGFRGKLAQENALGFWFQLNDDQRRQHGSPMGPAQPQALNRYSYVLNNPMRWTDPGGHWTIPSTGGSTTYWIDSVEEASYVANELEVFLSEQGIDVSLSAGGWFGKDGVAAVYFETSTSVARAKLGAMFDFIKGLLKYLADYVNGDLGTGSLFVHVDWNYIRGPLNGMVNWSAFYGQCENGKTRCDIYNRDQYAHRSKTFKWTDMGANSLRYYQTSVDLFAGIGRGSRWDRDHIAGPRRP